MKTLSFRPLLACVAMFTLCSVSSSAADPQSGTGEKDGYRLVWQDLFDASELNALRWNIEENGDGGGNAELQYYTARPENVRIGLDDKGNSCLILTARREEYKGKHFTSGRVNSKNLFAFTHGKVEAAIKLPTTANGLWPAFWMMGNDFDHVGWPRCGETDIMEFGHSDGISSGTQDRYFNGACHWGQGWPNASYAKSTTRDYSLQDGEFHIFTCEWDEESVRMYVDLDKRSPQTPYFKMDIPANDPENEWSAGNYFHKLNFILFNLAVGGNFPGIHDAAGITALNEENGQEASMYINYVKVYQKEGASGSDLYAVVPGDKDDSGIGTLYGESSEKRVRYEGHRLSVDEPARLELYNCSGNLIISTFTDSIDCSALPHGLYVVSAEFGDSKPQSFKFTR